MMWKRMPTRVDCRPFALGIQSSPNHIAGPLLIAFVTITVIGYAVFWADPGRIEVGLVAICFMLLLIFSGAHIAVVLIFLGFLGTWLIRDNPKVAMRSLALAADGAIIRYLFGVLPLLVLMGLIIAASMYSRMLTLSTIPQETTRFIAGMGLSLIGFMMIYLVLVIMGMIVASTSIMLILLPLCLPIVTELGGDMIWFGIVAVIAVGIGLLTPPFGLTVYVE